MTYEKLVCPICNSLVGKNNYKRHTSICKGKPLVCKHTVIRYTVTHEGLNCVFCEKLCKNKNSLAQHEIRCPKNPNRYDYDNLGKVSRARKGHTHLDDPTIAKQVSTKRKNIENGYVSPCKGRKRIVNYVHEEHNANEMQK